MSTRLLILTLLSTLAVFAQKKVSFHPEGGVHFGLKEVIINYPSTTHIFYTINGDEPTRENKKLAGNKFTITRNTALRFLSVDKDGKEKRFSRTYIIDRKHDLPVFSIITDSSNLFNKNTGIYVKGCCADTVEPYKGANFWKDWEREAQIAYITKRNEQVIDQKAGIKMFGGFSLGMPQKSFALYARKKYGNNRFEHSFFEDRSFREYKDLVLRNAGSDMQGAHIRDAFATTLVKPTGLLVQSYRPVVVYINGVYWGKYNLREKINEHFIKQHYGYDTDSVIIMRHKKRSQHGSARDYVKFWNKLHQLNLRKKEDLNYVASKIDIDNYLLYNACEVYTGNQDAGGNIRYFKHTSDTSKWRWIFYDVDHSMNIFQKKAHLKKSVDNFTTENERDWPHPNWSTFLIRKLLENDSIKELYIQRFCDLLNTTFKAENGLTLLDSLKNQVKNESVYHRKRWDVTNQIYDLSYRKLYTHVQERPKLLFDQLKNRFDLEDRVKVSIHNTKGGTVQINNLTINSVFIGEYFKNIPIYIEAKPDFDYRFIGWKELKHNSRKLDTTLQRSITLTPLFKKRPFSSFVNRIVINEIDAEQDSAGDSDYIELLNNSGERIDIGGWILEDDKHIYKIPGSFILKPGEYVTITEDSTIFKKSYKNDNFFAGLSFGINKKGEKIRLYDTDSLLVDRVSTHGWKREKNGLNWSRVSSNCENEYYNSWNMEEPTPGEMNIFCERLQEMRENEERIKFWSLIIGIIFASLGIGIILFNLMRR